MSAIRKMSILNKWAVVMHGYKHLHGGDLNEHENLKEGKLFFYEVEKRRRELFYQLGSKY